MRFLLAQWRRQVLLSLTARTLFPREHAHASRRYPRLRRERLVHLNNKGIITVTVSVSFLSSLLIISLPPLHS